MSHTYVWGASVVRTVDRAMFGWGFDPDGRRFLFDAGTAHHLALSRPEMANRVALLVGVVSNPDHRTLDRIGGREHFYRRDLDGRRWLRVVVDFNDRPGWIVTAFVQDHPPRGYR